MHKARDTCAPGTPFFKYAGGKRRLAHEIVLRLGLDTARRYVEPFVGAGAVFLAARAAGFDGPAVLNDISPVIAAVWRAVRDRPAEVLRRFTDYAAADSREAYYAARSLQVHLRKDASDAEIAAWFLYINKAGFNGLWRVNRAGECNVPYGDGEPPVLDAKTVWAAHRALRGAEIRCEDFAAIEPRAGDAIYCDPPYLPLSDTASFTGYARGGFTAGDQLRLARWCRDAAGRGARVVLSNAGNRDALIAFRELADETIEVCEARTVSCKGRKRQSVKAHLFIFKEERPWKYW